MTPTTHSATTRPHSQAPPSECSRPPIQVLSFASEDMVDLAPHIHRQRLVLEGLTDAPMTAEVIGDYLRNLAPELDMVPLTEPVLHRSATYGWAGWIHWETSGCHVYAWDEAGFFSVDIYTCKAFDPQDAARFTAETFGSHTLEMKSF